MPIENTRVAALARFSTTPLAMLVSESRRIMVDLADPLAECSEAPEPHAIVIHTDASFHASLEAAANLDLPRTDLGVAVVRILGPIGYRPSGDFWARTYSDDIVQQLKTLDADSSVGVIVLDMDTPGGVSTGIPELVDTINRVKKTTPIYSLANSRSASAGFWLSSQATRSFVTPSGDVGSHGAFTMHVDVSKMLEDVGLAVTLISAGEHKVEGSPFGPLDDEATVEIQRTVDLVFDQFTTALSKGRGVTRKHVLDNFGQGRMFEAERALERGMVDGIATIDQLLSGIIAKQPKSRGKPRALAASLALEVEVGNG